MIILYLLISRDLKISSEIWTFKVTGTTEGITAIQMDIKIHGLTRPIVEEAISKNKRSKTFHYGYMYEACYC